MDAVLLDGVATDLRSVDLRMIDVIGWDLVAVPDPSAGMMMIVGLLVLVARPWN